MRMRAHKETRRPFAAYADGGDERAEVLDAVMRELRDDEFIVAIGTPRVEPHQVDDLDREQARDSDPPATPEEIATWAAGDWVIPYVVSYELD